MMKELISVIVPVYNSEKWIAECCESVLSQSYEKIELILVNDGSFDSSREIIEKIALSDKRVKVINIEHSGVSLARNAGLDAAFGEYVTFLDSDDMLETDALAEMFRVLKESDADISVCAKAEILSDGRRIFREFPAPYEMWKGTEGLKASLSDHPATYSVWGKLYRKDFIKEIRFTAGKQAHEDSFFVFQCMLKQPRAAVSNTVAVNYRVREDSLSHIGNVRKVDDILYFAGKKEQMVKSRFPEFLNLAENVKVKANMSALNVLLHISGADISDRERECIKNVIKLKRSYIPINKKEKIFFLIVCFHMYFSFKFFFGFFRKLKRGILK